MTILVTGGEQRSEQSWGSIETLTQSTATAIRTLDNKYAVSSLGMGTATGFARNRYLLSTASAIEGMEKVIQATATGEAYLIFNSSAATGNHQFYLQALFGLMGTATTVDALQGIATATGNLVFGADGDYAVARFINGFWRCVDLNGATLATTT